MARIAIIGAGLAAFILARELAGTGSVSLYEKARGVGGRLSTRRAGTLAFDHGAQFFAPEAPAFTAVAESWLQAGLIARWDARFVEFTAGTITLWRNWADGPPHYVGIPSMNALPRALAEGLDIHLSAHVASLARQDEAWQLVMADGSTAGPFDWVISTAPEPQTAQLLGDHTDLLQRRTGKPMQGCFTLMLAGDGLAPEAWDAALVRESCLSWISVNSRKPGRTGPDALVVLARNSWADTHIEAPQDWIRDQMRAEAERLTGRPLRDAVHADLHRWRYANCPRQPKGPPLVDAGRRLAACGDWLRQGRVEGAWQAATTLAASLREHLG